MSSHITRRALTTATATAIVSLLVALTPATQAATLYWDINGATAGATNDAGGVASGIWDEGTTANWSTDSTGASATTTWADNDITYFSAGTNATGASTITINGGTRIVYTGSRADGLVIQEGDVTLAGSGSAPTLHQHQNTKLTVAAGASLTIDKSLAFKIGGNTSSHIDWDIFGDMTVDTEIVEYSTNSSHWTYLNIVGGGTLTLLKSSPNMADTFNMQRGTLILGANNATGTGVFDYSGNGNTLTIKSTDATNRTLGNTSLRLNSNANCNLVFDGLGDLDMSSATLGRQNVLAVTRTHTIEVKNAITTTFGAINMDFAGDTQISNLTKSGTGTLVVNGSAAIGGGTTSITGGTAIFKAGITDTTGITVSPNSTLAVAGTVTAPVTVSGTLAPGSSIGTLQIDSALTMNSGAKFQFEVGETGGSSDLIQLLNYAGGDLVLNNTAIDLSVLGEPVSGYRTYTVTIFEFYSDGGTTPTAHGFTSGLVIGDLGGRISSAHLVYNANTIDLVYAVPEPASLALLGLAGLAAWRRRR